MQPEPLTAGVKSLDPVNLSNHAYIVATDSENEYFLLECRAKQGNDTYIPGEGMVVWHVDYDEEAWYENTVNNVRSHQRVDIVEADNSQTGATRPGDSFPGTSGITSFGAATAPAFVAWSGVPTGFELTDISFDGTKVTFKAEGEGAGISSPTLSDEWNIEEGVLTAAAPLRIYSLSGMNLGTLLPGESRDLRGAGTVITVGPAVTAKMIFR